MEQPCLREFLLQGFYAALLTAPFRAGYFGAIQYIGWKVTRPLYERVGLSIVEIGIAAVGDGLIAMLCWKIVTNQPRSLTLFAAGMGSRILAILCQRILAISMKWDFSTLPNFIIFGLCYGLPPLFLTFVFLRLLNRGISWWVYATVFIAASVGYWILNVCISAVRGEFIGNSGIVNAVCVRPARECLFLCVLAAALWFSLKLSRPAVIPFATHP